MKRRILVIDDDESILTVARYLLRSDGFDVTIAKDMPSVMEAMETYRYECVIVDMVLDQLSGIEVLKKIKELSPKTPVIMMTVWGYVGGFLADSFKYGASSYFDKNRLIEISDFVKKTISQSK